MNVVDSSGWLEYLTDSDRADFFAAAIEDTEHLLVPVICIYEVFKKVLQTQGLAKAEVCMADMATYLRPLRATSVTARGTSSLHSCESLGWRLFAPSLFTKCSIILLG